MKKIQLLLLTPCVSLTAIATSCSCNNRNKTAEEIADAIFGPTDLDQTKLTTTFIQAIKDMSGNERKDELIYDIYKNCNLPLEFNADSSLKDLYKNNTVEIQTNITKCSIDFENDKPYATYLGYVSFVFLKDYDEHLKKDDYIMITLDFKNIELQVNEEDCYLYYETQGGQTLGFTKVRYDGGQHESLYNYSPVVGPDLGIPTNSKNWVK